MVVDLLELLEALHTDGVEISSIGDKLEEEVLGVGSLVYHYQLNCVLVFFVMSMIRHRRDKHKKRKGY